MENHIKQLDCVRLSPLFLGFLLGWVWPLLSVSLSGNSFVCHFRCMNKYVFILSLDIAWFRWSASVISFLYTWFLEIILKMERSCWETSQPRLLVGIPFPLILYSQRTRCFSHFFSCCVYTCICMDRIPPPPCIKNKIKNAHAYVWITSLFDIGSDGALFEIL